MSATIIIRLTPIQAKILFNTVDGAADAGACSDGNTPQEARALQAISAKLLNCIDQWGKQSLDKG